MKVINYTREDIIRRTGDKLNLTHDEMKLILDTTLDTVAEMLTEDKSRIRIELRRFGIFEVNIPPQVVMENTEFVTIISLVIMPQYHSNYADYSTKYARNLEISENLASS